MIKLGNQEITLKVGSATCTVYLGDTMVESGDTPTPPTPSFNGKWLATYNDGVEQYTESAECESAEETIEQDDIQQTELVSVEIGDCVTSIGAKAFYQCTGLSSVTIGSGVTSISGKAFGGCSSLTSIDIPSGVTGIGGTAFASCTGLTSITCLATTPPTISTSTFTNTNDCPIYVPSSSVSAYQSASGWSTYASRIQAIP